MLFGFAAQSQTLIKMEYFFDADPGVGSGTEISFASGSTVDFDTQISISGLSVGHHVLETVWKYKTRKKTIILKI